MTGPIRNCPADRERRRTAQRLSVWLVFCAMGLPVPALGVSNAAAVESFLDGFLPQAMASRHVPGLVITVVDGGRPILVKGYGVMDVATRRPVDPRTTLFDVQSVSKLMVSTAALIAAQHGFVALDQDINLYLKDLKIPASFPTPITLASLLTHTSGLEDHGIGITVRARDQIRPLGQYLAGALTTRVRPPFRDLLYSDLGMTLAAHTIESATATPFAEYARRVIFAPLKMDHTFYLEVPTAMKADRASAYSFENGHLVRIPHHYYQIWPSSSLWTTAADMSRFIAAQLQDGELDGARLLSASAVQRQHAGQFAYDPRMPGVCFDFFERFWNGRRLLTHSGAGSGFVSELTILPAERIGYFLSYNGYDEGLLDVFRNALLSQLFPPTKAPSVQTIAMSAAQLVPYVGWYWSTRYDRGTIEKLPSLLNGYLEVAAASNALIVGDRSFSPVSPTVFVHQGGATPDYVAFRRDEQGRVSELLAATADAPYERVSWPYRQPVQFMIVIGASSVFVVVLAYLGAFGLRHGLRDLVGDWTRLYCGVITAGNLACLAGLLAELAGSATPSGAVDFELGLSAGLRALLIAIAGFAMLSMASPLAIISVWKGGRRQRSWALLVTLTSVSAVAYVWFLYCWRVIGWDALA